MGDRKKQGQGQLFSKVQTEDLMKFGMIPEFLGRLPMVATLEDLDETALMEILTKPKNALVKQYKKLLDLEGVKLDFEPGALKAVAEEAIRKKTGARGLRAILENAMLDVMFDVPSSTGIRSCTVTEDTIRKGTKPIVTLDGGVSDKKESA
jgi:ATP-dependent Clp protease ATP-binding subunit ClpX